MSNAPTVAGYTPLAPGQIDLANRNKNVEELVLRLVDDLQKREGLDQRWIAIAKTHFQEGFMALNRGVFQPQRLVGPIDTDAVLKGLVS